MKIIHWRDKQGRFDSFKAKVHRFFKTVAVAVVVGVLLFTAFTTGALTYSTSKVEAQYVPVPVQSAVLDRIADCESGDGTKGSATHYKNGQVLIKTNANSADIGKYQINSIWFKKASELGFDLTKEEDNKKMAEWIYLNRGTGDWSASQKCWNK